MGKFEIDSTFIVRTPIQSISNFYNNSIEDLEILAINWCKKNAELLKINAPSFYESLNKKEDLTNKIKKTAIKYYIRSLYRTTPYGMNSLISLGNQSCSNNFLLKNYCGKRKAKIDGNWLKSVVNKIEKLLKDSIRVQLNQNYHVIGNKIKVNWQSFFSEIGLKAKYSEQFIDFTKPLNIIMNYLDSNKQDTINNLKNFLREEYQEVSNEVLNSFFNELIEIELLISEFRFIPENELYLNALIKKIDDYAELESIQKELKNIFSLIELYEKLNINEDGNDLFDKIELAMSKVCVSDFYLAIDSYVTDKVSIEKSNLETIKNLIEFLSNWSMGNTFKDYMADFVNRYGNSSVRFLDMISETDGIGLPYESNFLKLKYFDELNSFVFSCVMQSRKKNTSSVDMSVVNSSFSMKGNPISGEISLFAGYSNGEINYCLSPMVGSNKMWKSLGRFKHIFTTPSPIDTLNVYLSPFEPRELNVLQPFQNGRDSNLCVGYYQNDSFFNLENLIVGIHEDEFVFFDLKTKKTIQIDFNCMYNMNRLPNELKALLTLSEKQNGNFCDFLANLSHLVYEVEGYFDQITYQNIVLFPRSWRLETVIKCTNNQTTKVLKNKIKNSVKNKEIPDIIISGKLDQKLILNLNNDLNVEILIDMYRSDSKIRIFEDFHLLNDPILEDANGDKFISELVFQIGNNGKNNSSIVIDSALEEFDDTVKLKELPFDRWIDLRVYLPEFQATEFIKKEIKKIFYEKIFSTDIGNIFFVRYKDPNFHIRIRIKYNEEENLITLVKWLREKINKEWRLYGVYDVVLPSYRPETHRYGGKNCIKLAEKFFELDSMLACDLLNNANEIKEMEFMYILSVLDFCTVYTEVLGEEKLKVLINSLNIPKKLNNEFNILKKDLNKYFKEKSIAKVKFDIYFNRRRGVLFQYLTLLKEQGFSNERLLGIALSLIHMHHNRILGLNRDNEKKLGSLASRYIKYLQYVNLS